VELRRRLRIHAKTTVYAVVFTQIVAGIGLYAVLALDGHSKAAYSLITGTLCGALPNFYLALKMFSVSIDAPAEQLLRAVYVGESLKIVFATAMLALAISMMDLTGIP
jgi:F0F1-type ATP synthase assembly protein I